MNLPNRTCQQSQRKNREKERERPHVNESLLFLGKPFSENGSFFFFFFFLPENEKAKALFAVFFSVREANTEGKAGSLF